MLVEGNASFVLDADEEAALDEIGLEQWAPIAHDTVWVRLLPHEITGRRIPERSSD